MPVERRRYVGPYGRRHRPAHVGGVGYLYHLEVVELDREKGEIRFDRAGVPPTPLTQEGLSKLFGNEFLSADDYCTHKNADGRTCDAKRVDGSELCEFHKMLAETAFVEKYEVADEPAHFDDDGEEELTMDGPPPLGITADEIDAPT